jgi:predicted DNA-binding antitoxin AbrB/MazE fold protein
MPGVIEAVYENGVFRPLTPVALTEGAKVFVAPAEGPAADGTHPTVRDILSRRYRSGVTDTAARHDEHQP